MLKRVAKNNHRFQNKFVVQFREIKNPLSNVIFFGNDNKEYLDFDTHDMALVSYVCSRVSVERQQCTALLPFDFALYRLLSTQKLRIDCQKKKTIISAINIVMFIFIIKNAA